MADRVPCALVVDDEPEIREILTQILEREGIRVISAPDGHLALRQVHFASPDAVLLDVRMPGLSGMDVLKKIREADDDLPVVLVTAFANLQQAVEAMKQGAYGYLAKPFDNTEVIRVTRQALSEGQLKKKLRALSGRTLGTCGLIENMGPSDEVARLAANVHRVAKSDLSVVIIGETGSGKELVAMAIHGDSARREAPFVAVDCGAIPETLLESELFGHEKGSFTGAERKKWGQFELANGGTVFMDEVANLPLGSQMKFLRVLQDRRLHRVGGTRPVDVDIRLITATNCDLQGLVASGAFRSDLYWRLGEFTILLPPLRERTEDIPYLAKRFLDSANIELNKTLLGFTEGAGEAMMSYGWPGNVRQLRSAIRRAALIAKEVITEKDLGITLAQTHEIRAMTRVKGASWETASLREMVQESVLAVEKAVLTEVLKFTGGNKAKAARLLKIDYKTMHTKVRRYGIQVQGGDHDEA
ncbi:MAG: sigma-54 dependent transcriptional regulator [Longimicrobiales bacterium]|nr:sigma-54 dependent transcriptional regulator [Longimicrobiales bacterium]